MIYLQSQLCSEDECSWSACFQDVFGMIIYKLQSSSMVQSFIPSHRTADKM